MGTSFKLVSAAKDDLTDIARYTADKWGMKQALDYALRLDLCFRRIAEGKEATRSILPQNEAVRVCRCEHHYIFFLSQESGPVILAVLHERMDLIKRLKSRLLP